MLKSSAYKKLTKPGSKLRKLAVRRVMRHQDMDRKEAKSYIAERTGKSASVGGFKPKDKKPGGVRRDNPNPTRDGGPEPGNGGSGRDTRRSSSKPPTPSGTPDLQPRNRSLPVKPDRKPFGGSRGRRIPVRGPVAS